MTKPEEVVHYLRAHTSIYSDAWLLQTLQGSWLYSLEGYVLVDQCHVLGYSLRVRYNLTESANLFPVVELLLRFIR